MVEWYLKDSSFSSSKKESSTMSERYEYDKCDKYDGTFPILD